ncbi:hypothetical protein Golob_021949 [Gossypium lobatum]|uniref:DUF4283 domain-containing protein n=1 Tax=Gossypium lobatum TaxID=34289 RepID=A0A7J8LF23_9ROSI|nr:hypothetical protein [Gossypium lobatum]
METKFSGLMLNEEEKAILQVQIESNKKKEEWVYQLVGCFLAASVIHFPTMKRTMANLWHLVRGVQIRDLGEKKIHDVLTGFFSEILAKQLGNFIGKFLEYDGTDLGKGNQNFLRIRVQLDVRLPLKRKKQVIDSFCEAKMALGVEITVMGRDLSLRAQSKIALALSNIWLCEGEEGEKGEILIEVEL